MDEVEFTTALGRCRLSWNAAGLTSFRFPDEPAWNPDGRTDAEDEPVDAPAWVRKLMARIRDHLTGRLQDFSDTPLDYSRVSAFQRRVYEATLAIRGGCVRSYGELARSLGLGPEGARAVGVALATNPWPLIVPCHRVVSSGGRMTGFSAPGGVRTKTRLLALEGAELISE